MAVDLLLGLQWGDEGKGKIVDVLTSNYNIIARFQGGPNAGHTLVFNGMKHVLHTIPSGIFHDSAKNLVGNGVVIDPVIFKKELDKLEDQNVDYRKSLLISRKAHLILPTHRLLDAASEASKGKAKFGSTLKGIGPTYMDKTGRNGIRVGDLELSDWKERYRNLADKHESMIAFYNVEIEYNLKELEEEFFIYNYTQDNAKLYGGEFGWHLHPHPLDWLHLNSSFEFVIGKQYNDNYLPLIPANKLTNTLKTEFKHRKWLQNGFASLSLESTFKQKKISEFETTTNGYNLVNLGIGGTVKFTKLNVDINLNINNLLNKSHISHLSRLKADGVENIGRNFITSLKFSF